MDHFPFMQIYFFSSVTNRTLPDLNVSTMVGVMRNMNCLPFASTQVHYIFFFFGPFAHLFWSVRSSFLGRSLIFLFFFGPFAHLFWSVRSSFLVRSHLVFSFLCYVFVFCFLFAFILCLVSNMTCFSELFILYSPFVSSKTYCHDIAESKATITYSVDEYDVLSFLHCKTCECRTLWPQ